MSAENYDQSWDTFLAQHKSLLSSVDEHASLLAGMRKVCQESSTLRELVESRLNTTETMIATFKQSAESIQEITKGDDRTMEEESKSAQPTISTVPIRRTKIPKSQKPAKTVPDVSGLFTVDPNPTPIDQLYSEKQVNGVPSKTGKAITGAKRKAEVSLPEVVSVVADEHLPKKSKSTHARSSPPSPTVEDAKDESETKTTQQKPEGKKVIEDQDDDEFIKGVEARTKAREEKKKAKTDKKRKRNSDQSLEVVKPPKNKKQKDKHEPKIAANLPDVAPKAEPITVNGVNEKKPKVKRTLDQVDIHDGNENDVNDGQSTKRRKRKGKQTKL